MTLGWRLRRAKTRYIASLHVPTGRSEKPLYVIILLQICIIQHEMDIFMDFMLYGILKPAIFASVFTEQYYDSLRLH
jgi:hypothetical protein